MRWLTGVRSLTTGGAAVAWLTGLRLGLGLMLDPHAGRLLSIKLAKRQLAADMHFQDQLAELGDERSNSEGLEYSARHLCAYIAGLDGPITDNEALALDGLFGPKPAGWFEAHIDRACSLSRP